MVSKRHLDNHEFETVKQLNGWHIITCEYPPKIGGVSDYTFLVARELASRGDAVQVWCGGSEGNCPQLPGVTVHPDLGRFSLRNLRRAGKLLDDFPAPRRLFVQWVPHGYGYRSVNIFFCLWLWMRARFKHDQVEIMFHEVWLSFGGTWKANLAAAMHRIMVKLLKHAASRIWVAGESWRKYLQGGSAQVQWLPVPSNVECRVDPAAVASVRQRCGVYDGLLIGHFGIGDSLVERMLKQLIPELLRNCTQASFLLIGKSSERFAHEVRRDFADIGDRIFSSGMLASDQIAAHISACDLIVQPYIDGISTRRTAAMAALANGRPLLTTSGHSTEAFWRHCNQLALVPANDSISLAACARQLLDNPGERTRMSAAGRELYKTLFDVSVSIDVLRGVRAPLQQESVELAVQSMTANNRTA
ncbi:MAG TPA: glycosyltransferase family 4 protein [Candidatus Angelobacter sp.]|nr:glycosyltransferase family 4 protein [Candidatus Angelobacter sp.]